MLKKAKELLDKDYWNLKNKNVSNRKRFFIKQIRIFSLAVKGFSEDRVQVRASALTYYTLLSLVPIAAMVFGIAKGFGFDERLRLYITESFESQKDVSLWVLDFANKYLMNIKGGVIAGIGVAILLWAVMRLLSNIELSFNDIWQIKKARNMSRKMSDYISLVIIGPVLIVASFSINIFLKQQVAESDQLFPLMGFIGPVFSFMLSVLPYIFVWLVFMLVYITLPNTRVKTGSALIGGIVGGTMFQLFQLVYINFQSQLFNYGEVYGSFAVLPLFLVWMQLSWLIVLFGAEIAFANQNVEHYEAESESYNISNHMKSIVTLLIVRQIALNFRDSLPALTSDDIADKLDLPVRLVRDILYELMEVGIVSEMVTKNVKENAYQPATDTSKLSASFVLNTLNKRGRDNLSTDNVKNLNKMAAIVDSFSKEMDNSKSNILLVDL
jgi:membrane protein